MATENTSASNTANDGTSDYKMWDDYLNSEQFIKDSHDFKLM